MGLGSLAARRFNLVMPSAVGFYKCPYLALVTEELGRSRRRSRVADRYNPVLCAAWVSRELSPLSSHVWRLETVQHESTATGLDFGGLMRTS